jgi:hypothetical protein
VNPAEQTIEHLVAGNQQLAVASATDLLRALLARHAWLSTRRWMLATLIGMMAAFAGLATAALMAKQNSLLQDQNAKLEVQTKLIAAQNASIALQTRIAEQQATPQITLTAVQRKESGENTVSQDKIVIENHGAIARELDCSFAVFVRLEIFFAPQDGKEPIRSRIPVHGYYFGILKSGQAKGDLIEIVGNRNNEKFAALNRECGIEAKRRGLLALFLTIERYVRVKYRDGLGKEHANYYHVQMVDGARELNQLEGVATFVEHDRGYHGGLPLGFEGLTLTGLCDAVLGGKP